jgi:hypothetical protein
MKISCHKTTSVFRCYDVVATSDLRDAAKLLDQKQKKPFGQSSAIVKLQRQPKAEDLKVKALKT